MLQNYILHAFRNLVRQKWFAAIIVFGLTVGISVFGLIMSYVQQEFRTDHFNKNYEQIYRLEQANWALFGTLTGPEIAANFPEIISETRVSRFEGFSVTIKHGDIIGKMEKLVYADSSFLSIFTLDFLAGDPIHALDAPFSLVLTESEAKKIFGDENPLNQTLVLNNRFEYTVTGLIKDLNHFHIPVNAISSFVSLKEIYGDPHFLEHYDAWNYNVYCLLAAGTDPGKLAEKICDFYKDKPMWEDNKPEFSLRPLKELYFTSVQYDIPAPKANRSMLTLFTAIGVFILIMACVNFVNLTTARASFRFKEMGIRKVSGAERYQLITQFLVEAFIYVLISTELSLVLMELVHPVFNDLVQRNIKFSEVDLLLRITFIIGLPILITLAAGIYPAIYLTRFKPVVFLRGERTGSSSNLLSRKALIILQFAISIFLLSSTAVVYRQLNYVRSQNLGIDKDQVVMLPLNKELTGRLGTFRDRLLRDPSVSKVSFTTQPLHNITWQESIKLDGELKQYTYLGADPDLIESMGLEVIDGRNFQYDHPSDSLKVLLNAQAVRYFGLKNPVGKIIGEGDRKFEILGVVKDFHYNSLHSAIAPLVICWNGSAMRLANLKVNIGSMQPALQNIKEIWNELCPDYLFEYEFLNNSFEMLYQQENRLGKLFVFFTLLAFVIAALGLMGLSSFLTEQRSREISIRKANGASVLSLVYLLTNTYSGLVLIAFFLSVPAAWFTMDHWLRNFYYHTSLSWWIFLLAGLFSLLFTGLTVIFYAIKAALRNPMDSLRYE